MVLLINNSKIDTEITLENFYSEFPDFVETGNKFASTPCRSINGGAEGVLYIRQKEDVVTFHGDQFDDGNVVKKVGTQDVLTCHVVTLRHEETGTTAFAHFDEYLRHERLEAFFNKFYKLIVNRTFYCYEDDSSNNYDEDEEWEWYSDEDENIEEKDIELEEEMISYISENSRVTLQLVGGLKEESGKGGVLSKRILSYFATHRCNFIPTLVCLGPINTKIRTRAEPIVGGVLCDLKNGKLYPANFNRSFVDGMPEDTVNTLMLGPSLIKKPFKLKAMILEHEDRGYSSSSKNDNGNSCTITLF